MMATLRVLWFVLTHFDQLLADRLDRMTQDLHEPLNWCNREPGEELVCQLDLLPWPCNPWQEAAERRQRELEQAQADYRELLQRTAHSIVISVLELHQPRDDGYRITCTGCPSDAEYGDAYWPCETYDLIAGQL